jgi:hypothetical protein
MSKLKSRKFWMCVAAFLASIGASIAGIATDNKAITVTGIVCTMLSSAIYAAAEAYADGNRPVEQKSCNCEIDTDKEIL